MLKAPSTCEPVFIDRMSSITSEVDSLETELQSSSASRWSIW